MNWYDIGLIMFGAALTWAYTEVTVYKKKYEERKILLETLHQEIKQIRVAIILPTYKPGSIEIWPYIDYSIMRHTINSPYLTPKKDSAIIGLMVVLIKEIEEFKNKCLVSYLIQSQTLIINDPVSFQKVMFDHLYTSLMRLLSVLRQADLELSKLTKFSIAEDDLDYPIHTLAVVNHSEQHETSS
jgi:hypothetical protein